MTVVNKKTILVLEDEEYLLDMYKDILEEAGFDVLVAADGAQALKLAESNSKKINLMLLDLMLPGIDGLEVLEKVKGDEARFGKYPIVVLTNLVSEAVIHESFDKHADGYLMKTELTPEQIVEEVKRFVRR